MSEDEKAHPGPDPERLSLNEEDWREAVRRALKDEKPPEDKSSEGQDEEDEEG